MLLKIYTYLNWADKKMHTNFFLENKDQISDDLLADFRKDGGNSVTMKSGLFEAEKPKKGQTTKKPAGIIKEGPLFVSHTEFQFGKIGSDEAHIVDV